MKSVALVFLGGGIGASLRHLLGGAVQALARSATFPWGTFAVNVSGCFVIGLLAQVSGLGTLEKAFVRFYRGGKAK